jgi:hypothetical protein
MSAARTGVSALAANKAPMSAAIGESFLIASPPLDFY